MGRLYGYRYNFAKGYRHWKGASGRKYYQPILTDFDGSERLSRMAFTTATEAQDYRERANERVQRWVRIELGYDLEEAA